MDLMRKPALFFAILVGLFVSIVSLFVHRSDEAGIEFSALLGLYDQDTFELAGEKVPVDDIVLRQALDRELTFLVMNVPQLILYYKRAEEYFPYIEQKLEEKNMPDDIKYLAVAESALRNDALSSAGAAGIWQFLSTTAQEYGMRVDREIDERLHFEKATLAALEYLSRGYDQFGSWTMSMASYNRGMGGIQRAIDLQGSDNYYDLLLPNETMRYIFRIVSIKYAMQLFEDMYNTSLLAGGYDSDYESISITTTGGIDNMYDYLAINDYSPRRFFDLNPWVTSSSLPAGTREFLY